MATVSDKNGITSQVRLEPMFWLKLAGLVLTITLAVTGCSQLYVADQIDMAISDHRLSAPHVDIRELKKELKDVGEKLHEVERKIDRMEVKVDRIANGGG